jgi:hypothetical protein
MVKLGYILRPDLIDATQAGATIKAALSAMYQKDGSWAGLTGPAHMATIKIIRRAMSHTSMGEK